MYRMLMVDDDANLSRVMKKIVEIDPQWEFFSASSGEAGVAEAQARRPDVIILDFNLGELSPNGFEVLQSLRQDPVLRLIPVIMLTGTMMSTESKVEGLDLGADDYLLKPVSPPILMARARAAVLKAQKSHRMQ
ncbi:MAG: hypothetical protein A2X36_11275 [Elusimicrobia bacterium GWA2_69_24]|nr:MAG: hypothetical protein A2X36_11275 [Elusimicrobia bacterium GWA2_69_24]